MALVQLISSVFRLVFEASVIGLTLLKTLGAFRIQRGMKMFAGKSLTEFILSNGEYILSDKLIVLVLSVYYQAVSTLCRGPHLLQMQILY
jgi:hypothetical protein